MTWLAWLAVGAGLLFFAACIYLIWDGIDEWEDREERKTEALERLADRLDLDEENDK